MSETKRAAVLGAGVSGLSSAIRLLENEIDVVIIADKKTTDTTSAIAAAIWHPFQNNTGDDIFRLCEVSYKYFSHLVGSSETGVQFRYLNEYFSSHEDKPWWDTIPSTHEYYSVDATETQFEKGFVPLMRGRFKVPVADTRLYLSWLKKRFLELGGTFSYQHIDQLESLSAEYDLLINCSGLNAREITRDGSLKAIKGCVLRLRSSDKIGECYINDINEMWPVYLIPRTHDIILGGTAIESEDDSFSAEMEERIMENSRGFGLNFNNMEIIERKVGFRPYRHEMRTGQDPEMKNVFHNYGHGGSGFTVSWGCADRVLGWAIGKYS